jgi:hypothetical protein
MTAVGVTRREYKKELDLPRRLAAVALSFAL